jgi:hypothetical protein
MSNLSGLSIVTSEQEEVETNEDSLSITKLSISEPEGVEVSLATVLRLQKELSDEKAKTKAGEAREKDKEARIKAGEAREKDKEARIKGTYFSSQASVFVCKKEKNPEELQRSVNYLRRTRTQAEAILRYTDILNSYDAPKVRPAYSSARGNVVWKKAKQIVSGLLTPRGRPVPENDALFTVPDSNTSLYARGDNDILGGSAGQVAHLIPHAPPCAAYYGRTVADALGLDFSELTPSEIQALIHGRIDDKRRLRKQRLKNTGLKHNNCNKCQVSAQMEVYDAGPYMLIVPIMNLEDVKKWQSEPYNVLVLLNNTERYGQLLANCRACENRDEVDKALLLLKDFTCGMAKNNTFAELERVTVPGAGRTLRNLVKSKLVGLKAGRNETAENGLPFLSLKNGKSVGTGTEDVKVAVSTIGLNGPDPFLLATKAAVNLSNQVNQKLLPGCGTIDGSEDSSTDWPARLSSVKPPPIIVLSNTVEEDSSQFSDLDEEE